MLGMLRHDFPADQFDSVAVNRIRKMMLPSRGANQLTAARMKRYQNLKANTHSSDSTMFYSVLQVFLSCWSRVWAQCQQFKFQDAFNRSSDCLQNSLTNDLEWILASAETLVQETINAERIFNQSEAVTLYNYTANPDESCSIYTEIARFMLAKENGPELEALVKSKHKVTLRKYLMNSPVVFLNLKDRFPLAEWADLSAADIRTLITREANIYGASITRRMAGGFWGLKEEF
jgi:hypothetical protein